MPALPRSCKKILEILKFNELCSAQEIHARMRQVDPKAPGLSTTYRSLELLFRYGHLQAMDLDGERHYELVKPGEHHHHLICEVCGVRIHMDECGIEKMHDRIAAIHGFQIEQHVLEIFGKCMDCQAKKTD